MAVIDHFGTVLVSVAASSALLLSGCVGEAPGANLEDPVLVQGRNIYVASCSSCHGISGGGGVGPALTANGLSAVYPNIDDQIAIIADGRDRMPAFGSKYDQAELVAVVRYTREVLE